MAFSQLPQGFVPRDSPPLRYSTTLEPVGSRWLVVEAIGTLETPISGDDLTRLRAAGQ
jgi:hypothetical protein